MLFLASNRRNLYLGSERDVDTEAFEEALVVGEGSGGQEFIYSSGLILSAEQLDHFYWGQRYFTLLFVRPIPTLIWPTKYEDLGLGWMVNRTGHRRAQRFGLAQGGGVHALAGLRGRFHRGRVPRVLVVRRDRVLPHRPIVRLLLDTIDALGTDLDRDLRAVARVERVLARAERGGVALPRAAVDRTDVDSLGARRGARVAPRLPLPRASDWQAVSARP